MYRCANSIMLSLSVLCPSVSAIHGYARMSGLLVTVWVRGLHNLMTCLGNGVATVSKMTVTNLRITFLRYYTNLEHVLRVQRNMNLNDVYRSTSY